MRGFTSVQRASLQRASLQRAGRSRQAQPDHGAAARLVRGRRDPAVRRGDGPDDGQAQPGPAVAAGWDAWWASAAAAAPVPTISVAAVQLDIRRTYRKPPRLDASMFVSLPRECLPSEDARTVVNRP